ncbi:MAG: hypothetical protein WCF90_06130 [Methanomicrobiales archaeon]
MSAIGLGIRGITERAIGKEKFKPGTEMVISGLSEHDAGNGEELQGQKPSKIGIFTKPLVNIFSLSVVNPDIIVLHRDDDAF